MRILWYSTIPSVGVGYGVITKELVKRIIDDGHFVTIATKHHLGTSYVINGVDVIEGTEVGLISKIVLEDHYDCLISVMDNWTLPEPFPKWVASVLLDTQFIHKKMVDALKGSQYQLAPTKHCEEELKRVGFEPIYAPFGVDTKLFHPDLEIRKQFREKKKWERDTFVIGLVGINYATDRKNIIGTLRAFQRFHKRNPKSILYLHTDMMGSATQGQPLLWVKQACGFADDDLSVQYVDQKRYHLWNISQDELVGLYNAFDVFCLPTKGEGFGLPLVEAQACGCPVIVTETTSGKELCKGGWVIPIKDDHYTYSSLLTWIQVCTVSDIDNKMEKAFKAWENGSIGKYQKKAVEGMKEYDWDNVYEKYWRPLLQTIEQKKVIVRNIPDYVNLYKEFDGRIMMIDCKRVCNDPNACQKNFPYLPGEPENPAERNLLSRSYPIIPSSYEGEFLVDNRCSVARCLSPRFVESCKKAWNQLFAYPRVRKELKSLIDYKNNLYLSLDDIEHLFDDNYAMIMQGEYKTTFNLQDIRDLFILGMSVLDVGTGDGKRIKELLDIGCKARGTEINHEWITAPNGCEDDGSVIFGNADDLPFSNNSFDIVMSIDVLEHLRNPLASLRELFRVSKDLVVLQITPIEDGCYLEDPTHIVPWNLERWKREILEFGIIIKQLIGCGFVVKKNLSGKVTE